MKERVYWKGISIQYRGLVNTISLPQAGGQLKSSSEAPKERILDIRTVWIAFFGTHYQSALPGLIHINQNILDLLHPVLFPPKNCSIGRGIGQAIRSNETHRKAPPYTVKAYPQQTKIIE